MLHKSFGVSDVVAASTDFLSGFSASLVIDRKSFVHIDAFEDMYSREFSDEFRCEFPSDSLCSTRDRPG